MNNICIYYDVLKVRIKNLIYRFKQRIKSTDTPLRKDCYLDQCTIYNDEIIGLKDRLIYINYNESKSTTYKNIYEMLEENEIAKAESINAILIKIKLELFNKYPGHLVYINLDDSYKLKYSAFIFPVEQFIKVFTEPSSHEKYIKYIEEGIGIRYAGTKEHSPTLNHYICTQLINNGEYIEQNEIIELYSNFASVLSILNKESNSNFELMSLVPENINVLNNTQQKIIDVILGDNLLDKHLEIHEFLT